MLGVAPFVIVVVAEEPGSVAESPVEFGKESLKSVAPILASALPAQPLSKGGRSLVSHNAVDLPAHAVE